MDNVEPDFGYSNPRRTPERCNAPEFKNPKLHRIGLFKVKYDDDGLPGWVTERRCVGCGRRFGTFFKAGHKGGT